MGVGAGICPSFDCVLPPPPGKKSFLMMCTCLIIIPSLGKGFTYDVFISAHDETRDLVYKNILLPLEQDSNPPYKVCWHLRDFTAGVPIAEQIADAVKQSRKIIFVFSGRFSESKFCQLELDQAIHRLITSRTRCLVPIALNEEAVPKKLKNILTYWPVVLASEHKWIERIKQLIGEFCIQGQFFHEHSYLVSLLFAGPFLLFTNFFSYLLEFHSYLPESE